MMKLTLALFFCEGFCFFLGLVSGWPLETLYAVVIPVAVSFMAGYGYKKWEEEE